MLQFSPPPIFAISLADSQDRRAALSGAMDALGLPVRFIDAVDGRSGLSAEFAASADRQASERQMGRAMTDGEIACALSHRRVYDVMISEHIDHALILEDDAIPGPDLTAFLEAGGHLSAPLVLLYHSNARVMREAGMAITETLTARRLAVPCFGAVAYSLSRNTAQWLLDRSDPVTAPADWPADITRIGAVAVNPQPVGHPPANAQGQSMLTSTGRGRARAPFTRVFSPDYVRRTWRKLRSERIS